MYFVTMQHIFCIHILCIYVTHIIVPTSIVYDCTPRIYFYTYFCICILQSCIAHILLFLYLWYDTHVTVSYTHLDVYKRQIRSKLSSLDPFLDEFGVMRVGGRLQQSQLPYDNKHPTVLHPSAHITRLIVESEHIRLLHAGAQLPSFTSSTLVDY